MLFVAGLLAGCSAGNETSGAVIEEAEDTQTGEEASVSEGTEEINTA